MLKHAAGRQYYEIKVDHDLTNVGNRITLYTLFIPVEKYIVYHFSPPTDVGR